MVIVLTRRSPYQVGILSALLIAGVGLLVLGGRASSSLDRSLPTYFLAVFGAMLILGATTALTGMALRMKLRSVGLMLELVGQIPIVFLTLSYACFAIAQVGWPAIVQIAFLLGICGSGSSRIWQISRELKEIQHVVEAVARDGGEAER